MIKLTIREMKSLPFQKKIYSTGSLGTSQAALVLKNPACQCRRHRDVDLIPGSGRSLEEGMATHSTILAWRIPQIEEPGRLQSEGSQRVRHD